METLQQVETLHRFKSMSRSTIIGYFSSSRIPVSSIASHGTRYLCLRAWMLSGQARKAIQIGILVDTHTHSQLIAAYYATSSYSAHSLLISWWSEQVTGHRIQSGLVPAIQKSRLRLLGCALDPGVENIYLAPRWSLKWQSRSGPAVGWMGTVEHESMGTKHDNRALAATVS
ncbi:hypothetical protein BASA83_010450 [Batrachochytrium salamandrivorans]|nr:hypothetical protein BASA83_010450 [Batrachochytrium salamandrivorans]